MIQDNDNPDASGVANAAIPVRVWDWPVRLFHWTLVILLVVQVMTANMGGAMEWHMRSGYAVLTLVLFRIAWGFAGSRTARFASFVRGPRAVVAYARSLVWPPHHAHLGHNPLGGWMVVLLLALLLLQASTGLFANDDIATDGPLAHFVTKDVSDTLSSFHRQSAWVIIGLAGVHVAAILYYFVALKENLVGPMITGVKTQALPLPHISPEGSMVKAFRYLVVCTIAVWWVVTRL